LKMSRQIFIFGASGHAKVILDAAYAQGDVIVGLFDDDPARVGSKLMGCLIRGGRDELRAWCGANSVTAGIVAIGDNQTRAKFALWLQTVGLHLATVIHPRAIIAPSVVIGPGSVIMAGAVINSDVRIGENCIVNTAASVDHDCVLGDTVHIAPGCHLCGNVRIGTGALLGAGVTVIPGVVIGANALIGAGSTVIGDIPPNAKVAGSPCRYLK
jgi:sugar O-acyltransferase (sialic acid O-acetyltransferase NeuD family)